ncbi:MAG TPA: glycosyltransferase, partial [Polyangiales bacterium]
TANGVDHFIANSEFIARRIGKVYRREARVIYPPVDTQAFTLQTEKQPFYVTASRMVPYKRVPLIVEAFAKMPDRKLVVVGDGPDFARCKSLATPNVELVGYQSHEVLQKYLRDARAFLFAAEEDFGITLVEAQACGTPVIAFGKGGALETVRDIDTAPKPTGVLFPEQTVEDIQQAVLRFEQHRDAITPHACRANAERFAIDRFTREIAGFVEHAWDNHRERCTYRFAQANQRPIAAAE